MPSLVAVTFPPCISTRSFTSESPMPSPPRERWVEDSTCVNISNKPREHVGGDSFAGIPDPDDEVPSLGLRGERDAAAFLACISPRS